MSERFSHSRIEAYRSCPRRYKFQYLQRASVEKEVTVELYVGQTLHKCLQKLYAASSVGKTLSLEETLAVYDTEWKRAPVDALKVGNEQLTVTDYIKSGRDALGNYYAKYEPFTDEETLSVEARVEFTLDSERDFRIMGFLDRLSRKEDGSVEIIDYKYKSGLPRQTDVQRDPQMALYVMAARDNWPDFGDIQARLIYLKQNTEFRVEFEQDRLDEIRYQLVQQILEIKRAASEDDFPPRESPLCHWCPYYSLCPAKRHSASLSDPEVQPVEDELLAHELADRFLKLKRVVEAEKSELEELRLELAECARRLDLTALEGKRGTVRISERAVNALPTKTDNRDAFMEVTALTKEAGADVFEAYAELKPSELYKAYVKEQIPQPLRDKLGKLLIKKQSLRVTASYREKSGPENGD